MTSYLIRRLLLIIPTVFFAISFLFVLFFTLPGDPVTLIAGGADRNPNPVTIQQITERYGFDDPIWVQFKDYWARTIQWDLGNSFQTNRSVNDVLGERAVNSLRLAIWAIIIEVLFALPGLGSYGIDAIRNRDYPQVLGFILVSALVYQAANLCVDLLYCYLDPRIRYGKTET